MFNFSPLCVFKCILKFPSWLEAKSHWLHLFGFSPLCVFKCALKLTFWIEVKSYWLHWFDFSPLCVFKCVFKFCALRDAYWLHWFDFSPLCLFKWVFKWSAREKKHNHTDCIYELSSDCMLGGMHSHTGCICLIFPHCEFSNEPSIVCLVGCIVTLHYGKVLTWVKNQ